MAQITRKKCARHRIEFSMRPELHKIYTSYRERAQSLGLEIDFKRNFEQWFEGQLEQLGQELEDIAMHQSNKEKISTVQKSSTNFSS